MTEQNLQQGCFSHKISCVHLAINASILKEFKETTISSVYWVFTLFQAMCLQIYSSSWSLNTKWSNLIFDKPGLCDTKPMNSIINSLRRLKCCVRKRVVEQAVWAHGEPSPSRWPAASFLCLFSVSCFSDTTGKAVSWRLLAK